MAYIIIKSPPPPPNSLAGGRSLTWWWRRWPSRPRWTDWSRSSGGRWPGFWCGADGDPLKNFI